jgi:gamma-glutamylcyclotransferase
MSPTKASPAEAEPTIYFAFGSNLWLTQMRTRCPSSTYLGVARLPGYKWIINERGYANVVEALLGPGAEAEGNAVYGLVYALPAPDEALLDKNEGVPTAYGKEYLPCDFWAAHTPADTVDTSLPPTVKDKEMLVYIDRRRVSESAPKEEYVYRMNRGVEDAVRMGVPEVYIERVLRTFIPAEGAAGAGKGVEEKARRQAGAFVDENVEGV